MLDFGFVPAPARVRRGARRRHGAAGAPAQPGRRRAVRPGHRVVPGATSASALSRDDVERSPFYELLAVDARRRHPDDRRRRRVAPSDAELLEVPPGSPVLRCQRVTTSRRRASRCCCREHVFPAHRTEFVVDLPHSEPSIAPTGCAWWSDLRRSCRRTAPTAARTRRAGDRPHSAFRPRPAPPPRHPPRSSAGERLEEVARGDRRRLAPELVVGHLPGDDHLGQARQEPRCCRAMRVLMPTGRSRRGRSDAALDGPRHGLGRIVGTGAFTWRPLWLAACWKNGVSIGARHHAAHVDVGARPAAPCAPTRPRPITACLVAV